MMLPRRRSFIPGRKLLIVRNVAVRFPSTDARHPSSLVSSSGPGGVKLPPAFATRMSTGPNSSSIRRPSGLDLGKLRDIATDLHRTAACELDFFSDGR